MRSLATWTIGLVACSDRVALPDVPIDGGTDAQRAAARAELVAFDAWAGSDRVVLSGISFRELREPLQSRIYRAWDRVDLDDDLSPDEVRRWLRHELCHALDYAEGLAAEPDPLLDAFGDRLYDPDHGVLDDRENARGRRSEALARVCETGPLAAAALSEACPGDPPGDGDELFAWTDRAVWRSAEPWSLREPTVGSGPFSPWEDLRVKSTVVSNRISIVTTLGDDSTVRQADLATGQWVPEPFVDVVQVPVVEPEIRPVGPFRYAVGWSEGPSVGPMAFSVPLLGDFATRLVAFDGAEWVPVRVCVDPDEYRWELFAAADQVRYAWEDGVSLRWAALGP